MRFSKKSEYALRALTELTDHYGRDLLQRQQIAEQQHIPIEFLEQILLALKNAGLLASRRGVTGGYSLIKPPHEITLGQVIRILDGPLAPIACVSKTAYQKCHDCPYAEQSGHEACPIQDVMLNVRNAISDILDNYTLSDFAKQSKGNPTHAHHPSR
ncbi:MAG TPA: Rrf2 family transcriptional regulator [Nitrospiraceae bacterium]|jgi:Rrf2 family transcriptional regulator, cysteine metabolism repressor|nr:Rrf2 family transcriptional regulator [Nitrospiraceae bacterium]HEU4771977.1 Rrf2 family transcriptional regulator [Candidatus Udaeobacter sp.]